MKNKMKIAAAAAMLACVGMLGISVATAEEHPAKPTCMDIKWNADLLKRYPRAAVGCREVAVRDGKNYARFEAKLKERAGDSVTLEVLNVAGKADHEITIKPGADDTVEVEGKKVPYAKLVKGDKLTFWVPESRVGVISDPDATAASEIIMK